MRLDVLNRGYSRRTKLLFAVVRLFSGRPMPDAAKIVFYRPDFYGTHAKAFTHEAMRGPSAWSIGDRELMAAYVSKVNAALRETLRMLAKLTREKAVSADDMRAALNAGASQQQLKDALAVCVAFNTTNRLADAFGFTLLTPAAYNAGAKYLLKRGYQ